MSVAVGISQKYSTAVGHLLSEVPMFRAGENLRTYSEMSPLSVSTPPMDGLCPNRLQEIRTNIVCGRGVCVQALYEPKRGGAEQSFTNYHGRANENMDVSQTKNIA